MRVAVTGATGLIGRRLVAALIARGDEVTALSRDPDRARSLLGVRAISWRPVPGHAPPAPGEAASSLTEALSGQDGVAHLAGEPVAQRWSEEGKDRIRASRILGTTTLVDALRAADPRPRVLVSSSAAGYYGDRGSTVLDELASSGPADDFLASVCVGWERAADKASELDMRLVTLRNGVVLDRSGGALPRMLPAFKAFVGGPIAGGRQYMSWIALDDVVALYLAALDHERWSGPVNACAPEPVTNGQFASALGRALHRPAVAPVPAIALRILFGEMASVVIGGQRMIPARALELDHSFRYTDLDEALRAALR